MCVFELVSLFLRLSLCHHPNLDPLVNYNEENKEEKVIIAAKKFKM